MNPKNDESFSFCSLLQFTVISSRKAPQPSCRNAPNLQSCSHTPQPTHWVVVHDGLLVLPWRWPGSRSSCSCLQPMQACPPRRGRAGAVLARYLSSAQGRRVMMTDGSSAASSSVTTCSAGLQVVGVDHPHPPDAHGPAQGSPGRSSPPGSPLRFLPVVGFCWWPVMPVMELSRMMTVELRLVVGDVGQAGHAGVHEGGVADARPRSCPRSLPPGPC